MASPPRPLLDTGANNSIVDAYSAGFDGPKLDTLRSTGKVGAERDGLVREVRLSLPLRSWLHRHVWVMDLTDVIPAGARRRLHWTGCSLAMFSAVRLDYQHGAVEFEQ